MRLESHEYHPIHSAPTPIPRGDGPGKIRDSLPPLEIHSVPVMDTTSEAQSIRAMECIWHCGYIMRGRAVDSLLTLFGVGGLRDWVD